MYIAKNEEIGSYIGVKYRSLNLIYLFRVYFVR